MVVSLVGGLAGGVFVDEGYGLELRAGYQVSDHLELGAGVGLGRAKRTRAERLRRADRDFRECQQRKAEHRGEPREILYDQPCQRQVADHPDWMGAIRGFGRYTPQLDHPWYAASFGVGAGLVDNGLAYLTLDAGMRVSSGDGTADVYVQPVVALSIPMTGGRPIDDSRPRTTFYWGASMGMLGFADRDFGGSFDVTALSGHSTADDAFLMMISGGASYRDH